MSQQESFCYLYQVVHRETGQDYVGASAWVARRWTVHKSLAKRGIGDTKFYRLLAEHGPDAFDWKVVARARNAACAYLLERVAIASGMGSLNMTRGGVGHTRGDSPSLETCARISDALKVVCQSRPSPSEETRRKISATLTGRKLSPESHANRFGRKASDETRAKMRAAHAVRKVSP